MYKVYRNLNNGKLSIKEKSSGLVVGHADAIDMINASFNVSKKGVQRIRREKCKYVVATVDGGISWMDNFVPYKGRSVRECMPIVPGAPRVYVTFNPYKHFNFVQVDNLLPICMADVVSIKNNGEMIAWSPIPNYQQ